MTIVGHGCTLDCFDVCKFNVRVEDGKVVNLEGDKNHPFTKGFICNKGRKHVERLYHSERLLRPLKKAGGAWEEITFEEALDMVAEKLQRYRAEYGSQSVLHYCESGSGGILKQIERDFFNFYGGVTLSKGSTCWAAGKRAQEYDFGDVRGHFQEDMLHSRSIFLWGRNPANTSLHLYNMVREAKKKGAAVVVIDPLYTDSARIADVHVPVKTATDGALAMAMTKVALAKGLADHRFIREHAKGFEEYRDYLSTLDLEFLSAETGIDVKAIEKLTLLYAGDGASTIYPGYGLQKHANGGNIIRAIDALAAITGNVGREGGGVNYINRVYPPLLNLDPYNSEDFALNTRYFNVNDFAEFISTEANPPVKAIFVTKANPLNQFPDLNKAIAAFKGIEFKVCIDMFLTDTGRQCDLVIPCTNSLESEDVIYTSMGNPYIIYNEKAVEPWHPLLDEYYFFQALAEKMDMKEYPQVSKGTYLEKVLQPMTDKGVTLERLRSEPVTMQEDPVAWRDFKFTTPSGKFELYSEKALAEGQSPIPQYARGEAQGEGVPPCPSGMIRLLTTHHRDSLFSQHFLDVREPAQAYLSPTLAGQQGVADGDMVLLRSPQGEIAVQARIKEGIPTDIIHMYIGWWEKHGNPNFLTRNLSSEMGGQIAYYDTFVEIIKNGSI